MNEEETMFEIEPDVQSHATQQEFDGNTRTKLALQMLKQVQHSIGHVIQLLEDGNTSRATREMVNFVLTKKDFEQTLGQEFGSHVVEGMFDGMCMVGSDGRRYAVPENYASKSRLIEGDMLKLVVKPDGTHVYKQIGPVERRRIVGTFAIDSDSNSTIVIVNKDVYKVLQASVTYFKGAPGDEVVILVPGGGKSVWAAVERVVGR